MPRPTMEGAVLRRIDLHCNDGSSNKDYRITVTQLASGLCHVYTEHGPHGRLNQGGELTDQPVALGEAERLADDASYKKQHGRSRYRLIQDQRYPSRNQADASTAQASTAPAAAKPARQAPKRSLSDLSDESRKQLLPRF